MFQFVRFAAASVLSAGALVVWAFGVPAQAQTSAETPACTTSTGLAGTLFAGQWGMVASPVPFDRAEGDDRYVATSSSTRNGLNVVVITGRAHSDSTWGGKPPTSIGSTVRFFQSESAVVYGCTVRVVDFDPNLHDLSMMRFGDCDHELRQGLPTLLQGHMQVYGFSETVSEASGGSGGALEQSIFTSEAFLLVGLSPGIGTFVWIAESSISPSPDFEVISGICPFFVESARDYFSQNRIDEAGLCKGVDGAPVRLTVGQAAAFSSHNVADAIGHRRLRIGNRSVVRAVSLDEDNKTLVLKGLEVGTTSVLLRPTEDSSPQICMVVVE